MINELLAHSHLSSEQKEFLKSLNRDLGMAQAQIKKLEAKIAQLEEKIEAEHTVLTRPEFNREVARMLAVDDRYGGVSSVLYFDFASIAGLESRYGADLAAEAVKGIAYILTRYIRRSDIVGRLAVDEFGVLLVRCNNEDAWAKGRELAALLMTRLEIIEGKKLALDISFGAYTFGKGENVNAGLREASQAITKV